MANIHINRERQSLGQFPPEEVAAGLQSGRFVASDLAWSEGMETWKPLGEFPGLPEVEVEVPIVAPGAPPVLIPTADEPAWERRSEIGWSTAAIESVKALLSKPVATFASLKTTGGLLAPVSFYVLLSWITGAVAVLYQYGMTLVNPASMGEEFKSVTPMALSAIYFGVIVVILPILLLISVFACAAILHVCLMLVGGAKKPFETTLRVWAYANGAASVFQLVPFCGGLIAWVYGLVLCIIGLQKAHEISAARAAIAMLLPLVICCGSIAALGAVAGAEFWSTFAAELAKQKP